MVRIKQMKDYLEIKFWKLAKWIIVRGYGNGCPDYAESCASCEAKKVQNWIDEHLELIKYFK